MFRRLAAAIHRPHHRRASIYGMPLATPRERTIAAAQTHEATIHYRASRKP